MTSIPLLGRKMLLEQALPYADPIRYLAPIPEAGEDDFLEACDKGWEGLVAKRADSLYVSGRSSDWRKFKCVNQQEFVIGGYTEPRGSRSGFGALLLGYYEGKKLRVCREGGDGLQRADLA